MPEQDFKLPFQINKVTDKECNKKITQALNLFINLNFRLIGCTLTGIVSENYSAAALFPVFLGPIVKIRPCPAC